MKLLRMRASLEESKPGGKGACAYEERVVDARREKENYIPFLPALDVPKTQYNKYIFALCFSDSQYEVKEANNSNFVLLTTWLSGPELRGGSQTSLQFESFPHLRYA